MPLSMLVVSLVDGALLIVLTVPGTISANAGGAPVFKATLRVVFRGALAMVLTAGVGKLFGTMV